MAKQPIPPEVKVTVPAGSPIASFAIIAAIIGVCIFKYNIEPRVELKACLSQQEYLISAIDRYPLDFRKWSDDKSQKNSMDKVGVVEPCKTDMIYDAATKSCKWVSLGLDGR